MSQSDTTGLPPDLTLQVPESIEATITINGHALTSAQSMTIRVALESMVVDLMGSGLGDDDHGKHMVTSYLARIREIREISNAR